GVETLKSMMQYTNERHKVLASNVANADTPHYVAKDLSFSKAFSDEELRLDTTDKNHIEAASVDKPYTLLDDEQTYYWGDKNNVSMDVEVAKMTENALLGQAAIRLLQTKSLMYKTAIRGNKA
ncbi:MAG: flagellar basal body rod protein FlgB, partial [Candidatus Magnetoovum sp. WYHC-5]|nr:flagellar basal body rod protein FlgB [Candidatus Magnetoovum sp. WYHC-5]